MKIGVPKEIKTLEFRVGLTPANAKELLKYGHEVFVQGSAGVGSGFIDDDYRIVGCTIVEKIEDVYAMVDMIIKVKEPLPEEYELIKSDQIVFTYFHFAASEKLTHAMMKTNAVCIAYETVKSADNCLPLLIPMSEIAGRMAIQQAAKHLEKPMGGSGVLLSGVPGVRRGKVLILGGGVVGFNAAKIASGMGADVVIIDNNIQRLRHLEEVLPANCRTVYSTNENILSELREADAVIGAALIPGAAAPKLIKKEYLKMMKKRSVLVDVAVDQGGCIETCVPTTHDDPTYIVDNILHYCVANMPGAVPHTSTIALNNATIKYACQIANLGWAAACKSNPGLLHGLNIVHGLVTHEEVAKTFHLPYHSPLVIMDANLNNKNDLSYLSSKHENQSVLSTSEDSTDLP